MYDLGFYKFVQLRSLFPNANALPHAKRGSARGQAASVRKYVSNSASDQGSRSRLMMLEAGFWLSDQGIGNFSILLSL
jgi:hypothetical protein